MASFEYKHGQTLDAIDREEKEIHELRRKKERGWAEERADGLTCCALPPIDVDSRSCLVVVLAVPLANF